MDTDTQQQLASPKITPATNAPGGSVGTNGDPEFLERKRKSADLRQHIADVLKKLDQI